MSFRGTFPRHRLPFVPSNIELTLTNFKRAVMLKLIPTQSPGIHTITVSTLTPNTAKQKNSLHDSTSHSSITRLSD